MLADKAVEASNGTSFAMVGDLTAQFLRFMAKYAQMFVNLVFSWLNAFGIDVDSNSIGQDMRSVNLDAPDIEKPEF